jgi:hypothetical protein
VRQRQLERPAARRDAGLDVLEAGVGLGPRRVRPGEGDERRRDQHDPAGALVGEEALDRPQQAPQRTRVDDGSSAALGVSTGHG